MKKFRFLVPVFSFGLILAYAVLSQFGDGSLVAVSKVYAHSSKNFHRITAGEGVSAILVVTFVTIILYQIFKKIRLYLLFKKKDTSDTSEEETTEEPSDD